ncbi:MAG: NAD(P)/FAD-dependent oxidoreductase [Chthoniobacterales bacterium]
MQCDVLVVGGGPAGLRAAEVASASGATVVLCDAQPSVGRKFLVAGRGGLNLTHGEAQENFPLRYGDEQERWRDLLSDFTPDDLRRWAAEIGTETYVGTSGRVFPRGQKAAGLLRAWIHRLRASRVQFKMYARLKALTRDGEHWSVEFTGQDTLTVNADAVVLALGGASWPDTGSDGSWPALLQAHGIEIAPWQPANCGWEVDWPNEFLQRAEGLPLKNLTVSAGGESISGELLITRYGIEGGAIYRLTPILRAMQQPAVRIDLKPQLSAEALLARLTDANVPFSKALKLSPAATALLESFYTDDVADSKRLVRRIKDFELPLRKPRPIEEAISSAGGVRWRELDRMLMLRKMPGVFVAGEMIDWEAPTGGYLLQGCFATGTRAGRGAAALVRQV